MYESVLETEPWTERQRYDADAGLLVGGRCGRCGLQSWPRHVVCARCGGGDVEEIALPAEGEIQSWTRVWVPHETLATPYVLGMVQFGEVIIPTHIRGPEETIETGAAVRVVVEHDTLPAFWVVPVTDD
jgi:uncharacterized OB-fold protein